MARWRSFLASSPFCSAGDSSVGDWVHAALSTSSGGRKRGPDGEAETFRAEDAASETGANRQDPASKRTAQDGGESGVVARATYRWLTGIVGIEAVKLIAIVTLVVFFAEILGRVESIKVRR